MLWIWESEVEDSNSWCQGRDVQIRERGREVSFLIPSPPRAPRRPAAHATIRWRQHRQHHESWPTWTCAMMTDINHHVSRAASIYFSCRGYKRYYSINPINHQQHLLPLCPLWRLPSIMRYKKTSKSNIHIISESIRESEYSYYFCRYPKCTTLSTSQIRGTHFCGKSFLPSLALSFHHFLLNEAWGRVDSWKLESW